MFLLKITRALIHNYYQFHVNLVILYLLQSIGLYTAIGLEKKVSNNSKILPYCVSMAMAPKCFQPNIVWSEDFI
jgi:hypothetical protein